LTYPSKIDTFFNQINQLRLVNFFMESIPYDKRSGKIWFDGKPINWSDVKIHVLSHGLHYASCVFEG